MSNASLCTIRPKPENGSIKAQLKILAAGVDHTHSDPFKDASCDPWDLPSDPIFPTLAELEAAYRARALQFARAA